MTFRELLSKFLAEEGDFDAPVLFSVRQPEEIEDAIETDADGETKDKGVLFPAGPQTIAVLTIGDDGEVILTN